MSPVEQAWLRLSELESLVDARQHDAALQLVAELTSESIQQDCPAVAAMAEVAGNAIYNRRCEPEPALRHAVRSLSLAQRSADPRVLAHARLASTRAAWMGGDNDHALAELEAARAVAESSSDAKLAFFFLNMAGIIYADVGQPEQSIDWHQRAATRAQAAGLADRAALAQSNGAGRWLDIGLRRLRAGDTPGALEALRTCVQTYEALWPELEKVNAISAMVPGSSNLAAALSHLGDHDATERAVDRAEALARDHGNIGVAACVAVSRARMLVARQRGDEADRVLRQAIDEAEAASAYPSLGQIYDYAAEFFEQRGDLAMTVRVYKRLLALRERMATERAETRSKMLAIRLETERAHAEAALAREQARQMHERAEGFRNQSLLDPLTGLANRRQFDEALSAFSQDTADEPVCLAMIDVDHFKRVNDEFGHSVGDHVLRKLGSVLRAQCRGNDLPARFGGEEFTVIYNGIGLASAAAASERLRAAVARENWAALHPGLQVTVSIGLADRSEAPSPAALLALADERVYRAKRQGRNQVVAA
ncbi:diguanylate cyclase [Ideonella sp. A 288]|uniref:GGDEF domain-containing protein n=1 Tax=Ideonella sp. A 288 TaxID=1962181 RepID=UPI001F2ED179|nr:GGDEF domain-containing protein [Ideonella sp. A 288]